MPFFPDIEKLRIFAHFQLLLPFHRGNPVSINVPHNVPISYDKIKQVKVHKLPENAKGKCFFRDVNLWDLRKVNKKRPECVHAMPHAKSVDAAHFSPVNGHRILTTCYDNTLSIYDSSNMANIPKLRTIRYFQFYLVFNIILFMSY